jgi:hypothetical protein
MEGAEMSKESVLIVGYLEKPLWTLTLESMKDRTVKYIWGWVIGGGWMEQIKVRECGWQAPYTYMKQWWNLFQLL